MTLTIEVTKETITLPVWTDARNYDGEFQANWDKVYAAVKAHEMTHSAIFHDWVNKNSGRTFEATGNTCDLNMIEEGIKSEQNRIVAHLEKDLDANQQKFHETSGNVIVNLWDVMFLGAAVEFQYDPDAPPDY